MRCVCVLLAWIAVALPVQAEPLTVFAAASLKNAFDEIGQSFADETGIDVTMSYAGTSALARQIEQGAPADIFAAANVDWVDYLTERELLDRDSTTVFARNTLVLIAPQSASLDPSPDLSSAEDLQMALGEDGRLAVALVEAVPAGLYARQAMETLGIWDGLKDRLAQSDNVRSALFLVARGEAPLGIVYSSDAEADPAVQIVHAFPEQSHAPIVYSALRNAEERTPEAERFLTYLRGEQAQVILTAHGFLPVEDDG